MGVPTGDDVRLDSAHDSGSESGRFVDENGVLSTRAAIIAWVGVAALAVGSFSSIMWGWPLPLDGSGRAAAPMSTSAHQSGSAHQADKQMSGRFEVGKDGKLLRPSSAPIPLQPQLPPAAREETPEGMEAFARYVLELVPYMWMSGSTTLFEDVSLDDCYWCHSLTDERKRMSDQGGWVEFAKITTTAVSRPIEVPDHEGLWHVELTLHHEELKGYSGVEVFTRPSFDEVLVLQTRFKDGRWMVWEAGEGGKR